MAINVSKTKYILFHTRGKKFRENDLNVVFNNIEIGTVDNPEQIFPLERVNSSHLCPSSHTYKLLGIHFDEFLAFDAHVNFLAAKLSKLLYCTV